MATFTGTNGGEIIPNLVLGPIVAIGNDFVDALGGDDIAIGWSGDDVIRGGAGADVIIGGLLNAAGVISLSGVDAADYTTSVEGVTADLSTLVNLTLPILGINVQLTGATQGFGGDAEGDFMVGIVNLIGSNTGDDDLGGSSAANTLNGQGGADTLDGAGGNDILLGGAGADLLIGSAGADSLQGGDGRDTAGYQSSLAGVTVNLATGTGSGGDAQGDTLVGVENVQGSAQADTLAGDGNANTLSGNGGDDAIVGGGGNDTLEGGPGQDTLAGGTGSDTYIVRDLGETITENAGEGTDTIKAAIDYTLTTANVERLFLVGKDDIDATGSDFLDVIRGNTADNVIDGGDGRDVLTGFGGSDTFVFGTAALGVNNLDRVTDFDRSDDVLALEQDVFDVAFTGSGGTLDPSQFATLTADDLANNVKYGADDRIIYRADKGALFYDADGYGGTAKAVLFAAIDGQPALSADDFLMA